MGAKLIQTDRQRDGRRERQIGMKKLIGILENFMNIWFYTSTPPYAFMA
jgi:hypothetical protein